MAFSAKDTPVASIWASAWPLAGGGMGRVRTRRPSGSTTPGSTTSVRMSARSPDVSDVIAGACQFVGVASDAHARDFFDAKLLDKQKAVRVGPVTRRAFRL